MRRTYYLKSKCLKILKIYILEKFKIFLYRVKIYGTNHFYKETILYLIFSSSRINLKKIDLDLLLFEILNISID